MGGEANGRVLISALYGFGDVIYATWAASQLKRLRMGVSVDLMIQKRHLELSPLLEGVFEHVIAVDGRMLLRAHDMARIGDRLEWDEMYISHSDMEQPASVSTFRDLLQFRYDWLGNSAPGVLKLLAPDARQENQVLVNLSAKSIKYAKEIEERLVVGLASAVDDDTRVIVNGASGFLSAAPKVHYFKGSFWSLVETALRSRAVFGVRSGLNDVLAATGYNTQFIVYPRQQLRYYGLCSIGWDLRETKEYDLEELVDGWRGLWDDVGMYLHGGGVLRKGM
jgi:hypothetical protein